MSDCERIAQVPHEKWATVSDSLRSLMINEDIVPKMSEWVNCSFFWANRSFFAQKTSDSLRKPMSKFPTLPIVESISAAYITLLSQSPQCAPYCRVKCSKFRETKLCGVHRTEESISAVCIALRSQTAHRGVKQHTAESNSTPRSQNQSLWLSLVAQDKPFHGKTHLSWKSRFEEVKC